MLGIDLSAERILTRVMAAAIVVTVHGILVVLLARAMGDRGPTYDGRLSLNPFRQSDLIGLVTIVISQFGWGRPVRLAPKALRLGPWSVPIIVALSLMGVVIFAWALWLLRPVVFTLLPENPLALAINGLIERTVRIAVGFAVLNVLPIPPLCAGLVWSAVFPQHYEWLEERRLMTSLAMGIAIVALAPFMVAPVLEAQRLLTAGI